MSKVSFILFIFSLFISHLYGQNPLIANKGVNDPHVKIFNNKAYLYASHDRSAENKKFTMDDWWIWSSDDLTNWKYESTLNPKDTYIGKEYDRCWATDVGFKNGKYYWYFSEGTQQTGVVVGDTPVGPWKDVLKKPLLDSTLTATHEYDMAIFEDKGSHYIIFGVWDFYIAKLNKDMVSLAEPPKKISINNQAGPYGKGTTDDKPFVHKYGDHFYLSWGCFYAMSKNLYGPYEFIGTVINKGSFAPGYEKPTWPNGFLQGRHGSFFEWNKQWYFSYCDISQTGNRYFRDAFLSYVHYHDDGKMAMIKVNGTGVNNYDADKNWIEAEEFSKANRSIKKYDESKGFYVEMKKKDFISFTNIKNLENKNSLTIETKGGGGILELRTKLPSGDLIQAITISPSTEYITTSFEIKSFLNAKDICLVSKSNKTIDVNAISFQNKSQDLLSEVFIDSIWVANRVNISLQTIGDNQFVAYYDKERNMSVAKRNVQSNKWEKVILSNKLNWDSHNSVTLAVDNKGYIHISGNMHADPLIYYRSEKPFDISTMKELNFKVSKVDEKSVTYPRYFYDKEGELFYSFRSGSSGNGDIFIYRFDTKNLKWIKHIEKPLFDGTSGSVAYSAYNKIHKDKNGKFHFIWMWRTSPLVETCQQINYASSSDLLTWSNMKGESVSLPFLPQNEKTWVEFTPENSGLHNGKYDLVISQDETPMIVYMKYDSLGMTQIFAAKLIDGIYKIKALTNWNFRWKIFGGGDKMSSGGDFSFRGFTPENEAIIDWKNEKDESGRIILNTSTLHIVDKVVEVKEEIPSALYEVRSKDGRMSVMIEDDNAQLKNKDFRYYLRWESRGRSHGGSAPAVIPSGPVVPLTVLKLKSAKSN
jgi:arabinoxylan arabinofuranohydrolase